MCASAIRLKDLKKKRNNLEVQSSLGVLKRIAKTDENVMPQIINCVRSKCTLGEISDALRKVYGEYWPIEYVFKNHINTACKF